MQSLLRRRLISRVITKRPLSAASFHSTSTVHSNEAIHWTTDRLSTAQIQKVDAIFHKLLWLDMIEIALVTELVNKKLGIDLSPKQRKALQKYMESRGGSSTKDEEAAAPAEEAPKQVDLKLTGFDEKAKIKVIKEVRSIAGLGLKEAKELVESLPKVVQKGLKPEQAEELKAKLEAAGAQVEIV